MQAFPKSATVRPGASPHALLAVAYQWDRWERAALRRRERTRPPGFAPPVNEMRSRVAVRAGASGEMWSHVTAAAYGNINMWSHLAPLSIIRRSSTRPVAGRLKLGRLRPPPAKVPNLPPKPRDQESSTNGDNGAGLMGQSAK